MGRFAITESMGRYSSPINLIKQSPEKSKSKKHINYNTINKERNKVNTIKKHHLQLPLITTHTPPPPLPLHSLIGMGWV